MTAQAILDKIISVDSNNELVRPLTQVKIQIFKDFVKLYNALIIRGYQTPEVVTETGVDIDKTKEIEKRVTAMINFLNASNFVGSNTAKALQNRITLSLRSNFLDLRNTTSSFAPITMDGPSNLKNNSSNEALSKTKHPYSMVKQVRDIHNQYAGKSVVGIMAAGLKLYATLSYVIEKALYDTASPADLKSMLFNQKIYTDFAADGTPLVRVSNGFQGVAYGLTEDSQRIFAE